MVTMKMFSTLATVMALAAPVAEAATVTVESVQGSWIQATPVNSSAAGTISGLGTSTVSWGIPFTSRDSKSAYGFVATTPPAATLSEGSSFVLGTFTHYNYVIQSGTSIVNAVLQLTFNLTIDGVVQNFSQAYNFNHWETPNLPSTCANGGANSSGVNVNGCADRVQAVTNQALSPSFIVNGVQYLLEITAFQGFGTDNSGVPTFWTVENRANSAQLSVTYREIPTVPLPPAGLALLAGLAGLAALRARKGSVSA